MNRSVLNEAWTAMKHSLRLLSFVTALNVLVACGFALTGLVRPADILPAGVGATYGSAIFAAYAAARTVPLAVMVLIAIVRQSRQSLTILGTLAGAIQLCDVVVGFYQRDLGKTLGPLVICLLQGYALVTVARPSGATT
jgi:hypothetical protein